MGTPFWSRIEGEQLAQGDLLECCLVPQFGSDFGTAGDGAYENVPVGEANLIIVTQSCDLENHKVDLGVIPPGDPKPQGGYQPVNQGDNPTGNPIPPGKK